MNDTLSGAAWAASPSAIIAAMVEPLRVSPGSTARPWAIPTSTACESGSAVSVRVTRSALERVEKTATAEPSKHAPTTHGMCDHDSTKSRSASPIIAVGTVATRIAATVRPSIVSRYARGARRPRPSDARRLATSARNTRNVASSVPTWSSTTIERGMSVSPKSSANSAMCPSDEMGRNSVTP